MLTLIGIGTYIPVHKITDALLTELSGSTRPAHIKVEERSSVLPIEYLRNSDFSDLKRSIKESTISVTEMGERAAREAIERAGLLPEQIGLVIGESLTPIETTPAEAQRIAGRLGIKVPAYDVTSTYGIFPWHCSVLSRWRPERIPEYVLCVTSSAPTQRINYRQGLAPWVVSDGAAAAVFTTKDVSGLRLLDVCVETDSGGSNRVVIDTLGYLTLSEPTFSQAEAQFQRIQERLAKTVDIKNSEFLTGHWIREFSKLSEPFIAHSSIESVGEIIGVDTAYSLRERYDQISRGECVVSMLTAGYSFYGYTVFKKQ